MWKRAVVLLLLLYQATAFPGGVEPSFQVSHAEKRRDDRALTLFGGGGPIGWIFDFLFRQEFCQYHSWHSDEKGFTAEFKTITMNIVSAIFHKVFSEDKAGSCGDLCAGLCSQYPCADIDTVTSTKCTCANHGERVDLSGNCIEVYNATEVFISRTFIEGLSHEETHGNETVSTSEGILYEVSANLTIYKGGLVSLADARELVKSLSCDSGEHDPSSIAIELGNDYDSNDFVQMFPIQALLVINKDYFGICFNNTMPGDQQFNELFSNETEDLHRRMVDAGDGYLLIESVTQTGSNSVTIMGTRGYFFSMFEEGHFTINRHQDEGYERRELGDLSLEILKQWKPFPFVVLEGVGTLSLDLALDLVQADFGWWGLEMTTRVSYKYTLQLTFDLTLEASIPVSEIKLWNRTLLDEAIAPPPVKVLNILRKVGLLKKFEKIPNLKLGLYFQALAILALKKATIAYDFKPYLDYTITSGKKVTDIFITLKPFSGNIGVRSLVVSNEEGSTILEYGVEPGLDQGTVEVDVFGGVRPQIMLYFTEFVATGIFADVGGEIATRTKIGGAFPPMVDPSISLVGPCDTCHKFEGDLNSVAKGPKFTAYMKLPGLKIFGWRPKILKTSVNLLGAEVTLVSKIMSLCLWKQFGEATMTCGGSCCDERQNGICTEKDICCYPGTPGTDCCTALDCGTVGTYTCLDNLCVSSCTISPEYGIECCDDFDCSTGLCDSNKCTCDAAFAGIDCCVDEDCGEGAYTCLDNLCVSSCTISPEYGIECCDDFDCWNGLCVSNKCTCDVDGDCLDGYTCLDNFCVSSCTISPEYGIECCDDFDCSTGLCVSNNCTCDATFAGIDCCVDEDCGEDDDFRCVNYACVLRGVFCDEEGCQRLENCIIQDCDDPTEPASLCIDICEAKIQYDCTASQCNLESLANCNEAKCQGLKNCIGDDGSSLNVGICEGQFRYECTVADCAAIGIDVLPANPEAQCCQRLKNCIQGNTRVDICEAHVQYQCTVSSCADLGIDVLTSP